MQTLRAAGRLAMILGAAVPVLSGCGIDESPSDDLSAVSSPLTVVTGEYREPPAINDRHIAPWVTETWARVWRPAFSGTQRYPLVVMLHGAHRSCGQDNTNPRIDDNDDYASMGVCPLGYSVVKSHEGYAYLANDLASRGYIVVSINAHRGFPEETGPEDDPARLRVRGRLVLWHLKRLSEWDRGISPTPTGLLASFQNRIDFSQVGFMGHSRGGPGVRSALADYRNAPPGGWPTDIPNMTVRGVVEIASSDVPPATLPIDDPNNIPWLGLVGLCDNGVAGRIEVGAVFDRLLVDGLENGSFFKGLYGIYGGNHNYFNSQWQQNEAAGGCRNQTALSASSQRASSLTAVGNFFRSTVGASRDATLARIFDPVNAAPAGPTLSRAFTGSPTYGNSLRLEDFTGQSGVDSGVKYGFNSNGVANDLVGLSAYEHFYGGLEHDPNFFMARVGWVGGASSGKFLQSNWARLNTGWDLRGFRYLEFRVDPEPGNGIPTSTDFSIQLVNANNTTSVSRASSAYVSLPALPATLEIGNPNVFFEHPTMKTVRIPLTAFTNANLASVRGVRFVFNRTSPGMIWMSTIRAVKL